MGENLVKLRTDWHPETLASGRTVAPGEPFDRGELNPDDPVDARLLDEGLVIDAVVTPAPLEGDALQQRAAELRVPRRSSMSADDLRVAVARAEAERGDQATQAEAPVTVAGASSPTPAGGEA